MWRYALLILLALAACQPTNSELVVLPTLAELDTAVPVTAVPPTRRPLPPTYTPAPTHTMMPTESALGTPAPEGIRAEGTIYYIFDGDAIVELVADGSFEDLLPNPHIGQQISDLSLSPDGQWLAYIAPGAGSAREIYITDRRGTTDRPITSLGFAALGHPVWRPDSQSLAFVAAQAPGAPEGLYHASIDNAGQTVLLQLPSTDLGDLAWNEDGSVLFFSNKTIFGFDMASQQVSNPLTAFGGYGPDFSLIHSPTEPLLNYLKPGVDDRTGQHGGIVYFIDTNDLENVVERPGAALYVNYLASSPSGDYLLIAGDEGVWVQAQAMQTATKILQDLPIPPRPVFSPTEEEIAYNSLDAQGIQQIFVIDRLGSEFTQITHHQEGTVSDLVWAAD